MHRLIEGIKSRNLEFTLLFVDFPINYDSNDRSKLEQILHAYGIPTETVLVIKSLYKQTEAKIKSPDGDRFL